MNERTHLLGMAPDALAKVGQTIGAPRHIANQLCRWIYKQRVHDFDRMSDISAGHRRALSESYTVAKIPPAERLESVDGTVKYLYEVAGGRYIESAVIPDEERTTLCLSTQVGCRWNCAFCDTGAMGYRGDLAAWEIVGQYAAIPESASITNIVYMGMGDPLDTVDATLQSLTAFTAQWGYAMSPRRITVSTVGIIPGLERFLAESDCNIALSLHTPFSQERAHIMPVEKRYPAAEVIQLLRSARLKRQRRVSIEYVVFDGFNHSRRDVEGLAKLLSGLRCRINLIPFNIDASVHGPHELSPAPAAKIDEFRRALMAKGFRVTVRRSRGNDIAAACGRLTTRRFLSGE